MDKCIIPICIRKTKRKKKNAFRTSLIFFHCCTIKIVHSKSEQNGKHNIFIASEFFWSDWNMNERNTQKKCFKLVKVIHFFLSLFSWIHIRCLCTVVHTNDSRALRKIEKKKTLHKYTWTKHVNNDRAKQQKEAKKKIKT